jgi:hypothetical protein
VYLVRGWSRYVDIVNNTFASPGGTFTQQAVRDSGHGFDAATNRFIGNSLLAGSNQFLANITLNNNPVALNNNIPNLGIGANPTTYALTVDTGDVPAASFKSTTGGPQSIATDGTVTQIVGYAASTFAFNGTTSNHPWALLTNNTPRIEVSAAGNVLINSTLTVSGGAASFADGTSSAPAIANVGDLDTGVYFPAANEVAISAGGTVAAAFNSNGLFFRNRIINGDMRIDQRNAGAAVTTGGSYPVDRFAIVNVTDGAFSAQQDSSAPTGFVNSIKVTTTTADATLTAAQNLNFAQLIEGTNVADLAWGSANARTVTLSFWVRSSLTGTFGGSLRNNGGARSYPFTYSISVADTWEYKSVTIPGDTSGTWLTTTGIGLNVTFGLGAGPDRSGTAGAWAGANYVSATGAVSVIGTLNATWYVTGVQLETGSVATPFERRPFGTELMLCQRYYEKSYDQGTAPGTTGNLGNGFVGNCSALAASTAGNVDGITILPFKVTKRAAPTMVAYAFDGTVNAVTPLGGSPNRTGVTGFANARDTGAFQFMSFNNTSATAITAGFNLAFSWTASAEL